MIESPEFASFCGVHHYDDRLDDVSIAGYQRRGVSVFYTILPNKLVYEINALSTNL